MSGLVPIRFAIFVAVVLALPASLMAQADPQLVELGKLAMILSPAVAGLLLNWGVGGARGKRRWAWVAGAAGVTLAIAGGALAVAFLAGAARFSPTGVTGSALLAVVGVSTLTSVLEELGWAGGGLALAEGALGPRWGVAVLGLVWAAWHLVPVVLGVGLFPYLEQGPPGMIAAFVAACLVYRFLLTDLRRRAGTWLAAAAGHAAPNIFLAGLMAAGVGGFEAGAWGFFPAPGGLVFPLLALAALLALRARRPRPPAPR
ncbi:MAG: CPBP family intramembrane metalloprotease [Phenylobacterium sp.]|uniref:CPBP family glutamic-type intramembrane protease n=1 Tax=Phenylobacterium sp. TaxID=1871053 RepID=UPI00121BF2A0|nr:CPBP family glutamic-type intramembrane protease [Phenylobacterium sp.]TAL33117.1 MAG: CPBP family intramembrane metalloprotease [Phenylobacterium sp.]